MAKTPRRWNTARTLRASLLILFALDILFVRALLSGAGAHRAALQTIGRNAAPEIVAAQRLKTALAAMNADAANQLLSPAGADAWRRQYEERRAEVAQVLIEAARNIAFGREQRDPIEKIQVQLGTYEAHVQRAFDLHDERNAQAVAAYKDAANLANTVLIPAAADLDAATRRHLDAAWSDAGTWSLAWRALILLTGGALLVALFWVQAFLTDRTRRILNLPLLAATLIALGFTIWAVTLLGNGQSQLKAAKEDGFTSLDALWRARATAYSANADQSRSLLDPAGAAASAQEFTRKQNLLMSLPPGVSLETVAESGLDEKSGASGLLADEVRNAKPPDENERAIAVTRAFASYLMLDQTIRDLQQAGKHAQAAAMCTGFGPREAGYDFSRFDSALGDMIAMNRRAFDAAIGSGFDALSNFDAETAVAAVAIGLLVLAGLMPRIAEYR